MKDPNHIDNEYTLPDAKVTLNLILLCIYYRNSANQPSSAGELDELMGRIEIKITSNDVMAYIKTVMGQIDEYKESIIADIDPYSVKSSMQRLILLLFQYFNTPTTEKNWGERKRRVNNLLYNTYLSVIGIKTLIYTVPIESGE